jgi:hypothetical protein
MKKMIKWFRKNFWLHSWVYRNPACRKCSVCGRHEQQYCHTMDTWNESWWEVMNDGGDVTKHYKEN